MKTNVGIVGTGGIGRHLKDRLLKESLGVCFFLDRAARASGSFEALLDKERPRAVFIAISTLDNGEAARDDLLACARRGIRAITCEKGSLAYHMDALRSYLPMIGYSATVGGGTRMLPYVKGRALLGQRLEIDVVLNGTMNFVFDEVSRGRSLVEACHKAKGLGYAEPGSDDPLGLIQGELRDAIMKTCAFFNTALSKGAFLAPLAFGSFKLSRQSLEKLVEDGDSYRFVVSFFNRSIPECDSHCKPVFALAFEGWNIQGSFRPTNGKRDLGWLPSGAGNAIRIVEGENGEGGSYTLTGPGAGHEPTTSAMLADFHELCGSRR